MLEEIDHVNIVVDDLETMTRFYRDRLGFKQTKQVIISGSWIDDVVGLDGVKAEVVYLDPPAGPRVELIKYRSPQGAATGATGVANTRGLRHLAFKVSDIESTAATLARGGVELISDIVQVPSDQVIYADGSRKRLVYFRDPEGNLLELCEYRAAGAASAPNIPYRRRRISKARRRLYLSMSILLPLIAAAWYFVPRLIPKPKPVVAAPTKAAVLAATDPNNAELIALRDEYKQTEGRTARGKVFERLGAKVHTAQLYGTKFTMENILDKFGAPDLYRDLGPFRSFTYFYSPTKEDEFVLDVDFDRIGMATGFSWGKAEKIDHSATSWKLFPTTQSEDPKTLQRMLPVQEK